MTAESSRTVPPPEQPQTPEGAEDAPPEPPQQEEQDDAGEKDEEPAVQPPPDDPPSDGNDNAPSNRPVITLWQDGGKDNSFMYACPMCGLSAFIAKRDEPNYCIECMPNLHAMVIFDLDSSEQDLVLKVRNSILCATEGTDKFDRLPLFASDDTGALASGEHSMQKTKDEPADEQPAEEEVDYDADEAESDPEQQDGTDETPTLLPEFYADVPRFKVYEPENHFWMRRHAPPAPQTQCTEEKLREMRATNPGWTGPEHAEEHARTTPLV